MSKVVEETEAHLNDLHKQVYGDDTEGVQDTVQDDAGVVQETEAQVVTQVTEDSGQQVQPDDKALQHKYDTLQGMYNSDISKLQSQVAFLQGMLADQPVVTEQTATPVVSNQAIDDLKAEYPYVLDAIYAVVKQELNAERQSIMAEVSGIVERINARVNDVGMATGKTQASLFWSRLTEVVPDWEAWNTNQDFLDWLNEEDQLSGYKRFDLLKQAKANYNADKVGTFFIEFKRQKGITQAPQRQLSQGQQMVAPGRSTGSVSQTVKQGGDAPLTREDISRFYNDVRRGVYAGRDKEKQDMESRIAKMASGLSGKR